MFLTPKRPREALLASCYISEHYRSFNFRGQTLRSLFGIIDLTPNRPQPLTPKLRPMLWSNDYHTNVSSRNSNLSSIGVIEIMSPEVKSTPSYFSVQMSTENLLLLFLLQISLVFWYLWIYSLVLEITSKAFVPWQKLLRIFSSSLFFTFSVY